MRLPKKKKSLKVLIACEYSGRVRDAFLKKGHDATSCDLLPTESPGPHYQGNVFDIIYDRWDLLIAHPPCTYLTCAAEWAFSDKPMINGKPRNMKSGTLIGVQRRQAREDALTFVSELYQLRHIPRICIENPVGVINKELMVMPKPQYVQQYWFGEDDSKKTGLWLKNLNPLTPTDYIEPRLVCCGEKMPRPRWGNQTDSGQNKLPPGADRWKLRSTTPQGLADAMADQWG